MLNFLRILLFPFLGPMRKAKPKATPAAAPRPSANPNLLHLFHGGFGSELEATEYCLAPTGRDGPSLTQDLPDAHIDAPEVEIIFEAARIAAALPMLIGPIAQLWGSLGADNTMVLIPDTAVAGTPDALGDTPHLRYAGAFDVR